MQEQSKEAIKAVFENFDKDHSGFIDVKEVHLIAKELNQEIKESEIGNIMKDLDINKDGKISFDEFWDWWKFGKGNKLEKLVFYKLKALNLLKKAHSEFVHLGASLESKYDTSMDNHYIAVNLGESACGLSLNLRLIFGNLVNEVWESFKKNQAQINDDFFGIIIKVKTTNAGEAKTKIEDAWHKNILPKFNEQLDMMQSLIENFLFQFGVDGDYVTMAIGFNGPFIEGMVLQPYNEKVIPFLGETFNLKLEIDLGLMNDLSTFASMWDDKFVSYFMKGFIGECKMQVNSDFLKQMRKALLSHIEAKFGNAGSSTSKTMLTLMTLLQGSKAHLVFRDMGDVASFFEGMGLDALLQDQPSCKELISELRDDFTQFELMESWKEQHVPQMELINFLMEHGQGDAEFCLKLPKAILAGKLHAPGAKAFAEKFFKDDDQDQQ